MSTKLADEDLAEFDTRSRESSVFEPPSYAISYVSDRTGHSLEWNPPLGSKELAIALSYHFPLEKNLAGQMRAAIQRYRKAESKKIPVTTSSLESPADTVHEIGTDNLIKSASNTRLSTAPSPENIELKFKNDISASVVNKSVAIASLLHNQGQSAFYVDIPGPAAISGTISVPPLEIQRWMPTVGESPKRKKRRYGKEEGAKVAANRGNACQKHQKRKEKVFLSQISSNM